MPYACLERSAYVKNRIVDCALTRARSLKRRTSTLWWRSRLRTVCQLPRCCQCWLLPPRDLGTWKRQKDITRAALSATRRIPHAASTMQCCSASKIGSPRSASSTSRC